MYDKEKTLNLMDKAKSGDKKALSDIVDCNMGLVKSIALRFTGRGTDTEDLFQIGAIGLIKAIHGFDANFGTAFSTYAVPHIIGEIRRFLRDDGLIKISRDIKKNAYILLRAKSEFEEEKGVPPSITELCYKTGIDFDDAVMALDAACPALSLNETVSGNDDDSQTLENFIGEDQIGKITENIALHEAINSLSEEEKMIIYLRYFKGLTQTETAARLSLSQVKISRNEKKIIEKLRGLLNTA